MKNLNPNKWENAYKWQFEAYPFFVSVYQKSSAPTKNKYFTSFHELLHNFTAGQVHIFEPRKEIFRKGMIIINELLRGNDNFYKEFKRVFQEINKAIKICEKFRREGRYEELEKWWPETQNALSDATCIVFNFDYPLDDFLKDLSLNNPEDLELLSKSIFTKEPSFIDEANSKLLQLNKKHPNNFKKVMEEFIGEYGWFQNSYLGKFKITERWLKSYLNSIKRKSKKLNSKPAKLPKKYKLLAKAACLAIEFRDDKKKLLLIAAELMENWLRDVCRENGWKYEMMRWLSMDEVLEVLKVKGKNPPNPPLLKGALSRAEKYFKNNRRIGIEEPVGYLDVSDKFWKEVLKKQQVKIKKEFSGVIANKGKYKGIVKVIIDARRGKINFKKGEILVTSMTRPEFLPLMAKAGAFITDEGGISCHAAIIAREMNKPCIIGTKIATRILKDGDLVEVDANQGIIKVLTR